MGVQEHGAENVGCVAAVKGFGLVREERTRGREWRGGEGGAVVGRDGLKTPSGFSSLFCVTRAWRYLHIPLKVE